MTLQATVVVPTHDHGPTLLFSVRSALSQSVQETEVLIVGDGVPDVTREIVGELMKEDERVRFFDNPKGPRHGEIHRRVALEQAQGEIVAYLADDDLWLPDHLETVARLLRDADFAHSLPLWVTTDDTVETWTVDLKTPFFRDLFLSGHNRVPLACAAHTLAMYRKLPEGWRTTPEGIFTDLYMWQQFLSHQECRVVSGDRPTVIHFPSHLRAEWTIQQRLDELERWASRLSDSNWRSEFVIEVLGRAALERARLEAQAQGLAEQLRELEQEASRSEEELRDVVADRDRLAVEGVSLREELEITARERDQRRDELDAIYRLRWWRLREQLLRLPLVARLFRLAGRALAGPSGR